jgi:hypothetical protein
MSLIILATGCATPKVQPADPQLLFKSDLLSFLGDGVTTREEVVLKLGIPSAQIEGEKILMYQLKVDEDGKWDPAPQAHAKPARSDVPGMPVRFRMGEFCYRGADSGSTNLIGHKVAAFGVIVADVRTYRPFIDTVRSAITAQLETAGHHLVDRDPDVIITSDLAKFGVTTSISLSSWDAIGSLDITVKFHSSSNPHDLLMRRYQLKHVSKTVLGPSKKDFEQVMRACLEDMQKKMASDAELAEMLRSKTR